MEENVKIEVDSKGRKLENPMGYAPLFPLIMKMSLPSMFAMLISALYNIVDSIYVARLSEDALSAVSLVYPIQLLNIAVCVGTGVGLSSLISRRLGEKRLDDAENAVNHGLVLANLEYLVFLLFGIFGSGWFCRAFSTDAALVEPATTYCTIVCIGSVFIFNALAAERSMQACGNMLYPMFSQVIGSVVNIILDPIMIFGYFGCPAMGVKGAAIATVIGQACSMIASYIFFNIKDKFPIKMHLKEFKFDLQTVKDIYEVALPAMVMQSITAITTIAQNKILIGFSSTAVAVLGAYFKLQSFAFMPVLGLNQGVMPIMGFNYGARNKKRLLDTLKDSLILAVGIMIFCLLIFQLLPDKILLLFKPSEEMMTMGCKALRTISWCFPFAALSIIPGAMFQATAHGIYSMICSILRQIVLIIPIAYFLSKVIGVDGVWLSYVLAEGSALIYTWIMVIRLYKREIKNL